MLILTGLLTLLVFTVADEDVKGGVKTVQEKVTQDEIVPSPYSFNVKTGAAYGTKVTQEEVGDAQGRVKGPYSIASPRGVSRVVEYHADDSGFHASVKTSEPNIKTHSPANAHLEALTKKGAIEAIRHAAQDPIDQAGKAHASPALHHSAVLPQSQEKIQEKVLLESEPSGVKTSDPLKFTTKVQAGGIKSIASPSAEIKQSSIKSVAAASSGVKQSGVKTINVPKSGVKSSQFAGDSEIKGGLLSQHQRIRHPSSISLSTAKKIGDSSSGSILFSLSNVGKESPEVNRGPQRESLNIQAKPFKSPSGGRIGNAQSELIAGNRRIILDDDIIKKLGLTSDDSRQYIVLPPGLANIAGSELESKIRISGHGLNQGIQLHSNGEKIIEKNAGGSISRVSPEIKPILRSQTEISRQTPRDQIRKLPTLRRQSSLQATGRLTSGTGPRNIGQIPRQRSSNQIGAQGLYIAPAYGIGIAQGTGQPIQTRHASSSLQKEEKASFLSVEPNLNFQSNIAERADIRLLTSGGKYDSPVLPSLQKDKLVSPGSIRPKAPFDRVLNQVSGSAASSGSLQTARTFSAALRGSNLQKQISAGRTATTASRLTGFGSGSTDSKSGSIYFVLGDSFQQQKPAAAGLTTSDIIKSAAKPQIVSGVERPEIFFSAEVPKAIQPQISPAVSQRLTGIRTSQFQTSQRVSGSPASSSPLNYQQAVRSSLTLDRRTSVGTISRSPGQPLSVTGGPQIVSAGGGSAGSRSEKQFGVRQSFSGASRSQISSSQRSSPGVTPQRITTYKQETRSSVGLDNRVFKSSQGISSQRISGVGGSQLLFTPAVSGASLFEGKPGVSQTATGIHGSELLLGQIIPSAPRSQGLATNQQAARRSASLGQTRSYVTIGKRFSVADKAILGDSGQQIVFTRGALKPAQPQSQSAYDSKISKIRSSQIPATQNLAGITASRLTVASGSSQAQGPLGLTQKATDIRVSPLSPEKRAPAAPASKPLSIPTQAFRSSASLGLTTSGITQTAGKEQAVPGIKRPEMLFAAGIHEVIQPQISQGVSQRLTGLRASQFQSSQRLSAPAPNSPLTYQQGVRSSSTLGRRTSVGSVSRSPGQALPIIGGPQILSTGDKSAGSRSEKQFGVRQSFSGAPRSQISSSQRSPSITTQRITKYQQETRSSAGLGSRGLNSPEGISSQSISGIGGSQLLFTPAISGASLFQGKPGVSQTAASIHGSELLFGQIISGAPISQFLATNQEAARSSASLDQTRSEVTIGKRLGVADKAILGDSGQQIVFTRGTLKPVEPQSQSAYERRISKIRSSQIPATQRLAGIPAPRATVASGTSQIQAALGLNQKAAFTHLSQLSPEKKAPVAPASKPLSIRTQALRSKAPLGLTTSSIRQPARKEQTISRIERPEILFAAGVPEAIQPQISPAVSQGLAGIHVSQIQTNKRSSVASVSHSPLPYQQTVRSSSTLGGRIYGTAPATLHRSSGQTLSFIGGLQTVSVPGVSPGRRSEKEFGVRQSLSGARPTQISSSQRISGVSAPKIRTSQQATRSFVSSERKAFSSSVGASAGISGIGASEILFASGVPDASHGISGGGFRPEGAQPQTVAQLTQRGSGISSSQFSRSQGISGIGASSSSSTSQQAVRSSTSSDRRTYGTAAEGISSSTFFQPGSGIEGPQITFITGVDERGGDKNLLGGRGGSSGSVASQLLRSQPGSVASQRLTSNQQATRSAATFDRGVSGSIPVAVSGTHGQPISGVGAPHYSVLLQGEPGEIQTQSRGIQQSTRSQISGQRRPGGSLLPFKYQQPARIPTVRISGAPQTDQSVIRAGGSQRLFASGKPVLAQIQRTVSGRESSSRRSQFSSVQRTSGIPISRNDPITASVIGPSSGTLGTSQRNSGARSSQIAKNVRVSAAPKPSLLSIRGAADLRSPSQRTAVPTTSLRNIGIQGTSGTGGVATASRLTNVELLKIPSATESRSPQVSHSSTLNIGLGQAERHNLNKIAPEVVFYGSSAQSIPEPSRIVSQTSGLRKPETGKLNSQSKIESPVVQEKLHSKNIIQKEVLQLKEPSIKFEQVEQSKLSTNPSQVLVDVPTSQEKLSDGSQIKIEEVIEHSPPSQPQIIKLTQETIIGKKQPAEAPSKSVVSKTIVTKVVSESAPKPAGTAFGSRDVQSVQQKLTDLDQSLYLPPASILSPFNYAVPILPSARTGVKTPIVQEQQKLEQILV